MAELPGEKVGEILAAVGHWSGRRGWPHWEDLEEGAIPEGLSAEETWMGLKLGRVKYFQLPGLLDAEGRSFHFSIPESLAASLHRLDRGMDLGFDNPSEGAPRDREPYVTSATIQEAVASARLARVETPWEAAKGMLLTGRNPRDRDERVIHNIHLALQRVRKPESGPLTPGRVRELHALLMEGAGAETDESPAEGLSMRLEAMSDFANGITPDEFVHPVVRAVLLHSWVAFARPFADGNGRLARTLFHGVLAREGYRIFECLSLSRVMLREPDRYAQAFRRVTTDENDLTHFLVHQMEMIDASVQVLADDRRRRSAEFREVEARLRGADDLNHRQQAVLVHALGNPGARYIIEGHRRCHGVVFQTARTDLFDLAERGLLDIRKEGRVNAFYAPGDLRDKLARLSGDLSEAPGFFEDDSLPVNLL